MIFEIQHGSFDYGEKTILNNISFSLNAGEVLCVLGSNGAGKTTLLKCMMGLLKWKKGRSLVDGIEISRIPHRILWQKIAYVPQAKSSIFSFTALDMTVLGRASHLGIFKQPAEKDIALAAQAMKDVGIFHFKDKLCTEMSGGELQMVLIARALSANPQMLVLDEPESNLDFKNQLVILNTIKRLALEKGISAIVNTHYPAHAIKIADKSIILNKNGTCCFGKADEVINEENMRKAFNVQVHINDFEHHKICYKNIVPLYVV